MKVGFAGIGRMGRPMAHRLAKAGHQVAAYDPVATLDEELAASGVSRARSVEALAACELTISMLPDAAATRRLLLAEDGLLAWSGPGACHVVMGTMSPADVRELAGAADRAGVALADAPVSGSVSMAEAGTISTMVGADGAVFVRIRPVLAAMTSAQFHAGPVGAGSVAKLAVNVVVGAVNEAVAEALTLASSEGVPAGRFYDILEASAGASPYVRYRRATFLDPDNQPVAAPVSIIDKDLRLAIEAAGRHGLWLPGAEARVGVLARSVARGEAGLDMAQVLRIIGAPASEPRETQ